MSVLRKVIGKMKKFILCLCLLFSMPAWAAENDMFSEQFLVHLSECKPYEETKTGNYQGIDTKTVYIVVGREGDECLMTIHSQRESGAKILQTCRFDESDLAEYVEAAQEILKKEPPEDFVQALSRSTDEQIMQLSTLQVVNCRTQHAEIDTTKNVREHLANCSPFTEAFKAGRTEFVRRIVGQEKDKCHYVLEYWKRAPRAEEYKGKDEEFKKLLTDLDDLKMTFDCVLDNSMRMQLIRAQEKMIVPAYDSDDDNEIDEDSFDPAAEIDFVSEKCEQKQELIKVNKE